MATRDGSGTTHTLPDKPPGLWYAVVIGDPEGGQLVDGEGSFPVPDLGSDCVCCNAPDVDHVSYNPSTGPFRSTVVPIPLCEPCRAHVRLDEKWTLYIVAAGFMGILLGVIGIFAAPLISAVGAVLLIAAVGLYFWDSSKRRGLSQSGHHAGLDIAASPGICSVRTMNRRVAEHVMEHHKDILVRVK